MKNKKLRITQEDFLLANRRASRAEEIEAHGKQIIFRPVKQKSKKVYDRKRLKRAAIKSDDGSFYLRDCHHFASIYTLYDSLFTFRSRPDTSIHIFST